MLFVPLESLMDLVNSLHVSTAHSQALNLFLCLLLIQGNTFVILNSGDEIIDLPVFVNYFLEGLEFTLFSFVKKIVLLGFLSSYGVDIKALTLKLVMLHKLIGSAVVSVPLVQDVLADLIEGLRNIQVKGKQSLHNLSVYLVVFIIKLLLLDKV